MKIKVLFFGYLTERLGSSELEVEADSLNGLKATLNERFPTLKDLGCLYAVNQEVAQGDLALKAGDEVALMPPFAGG